MPESAGEWTISSSSGHTKLAPKRLAPSSKAISAKRQRTESPYVIGSTGHRLWRDSESATVENLPADVQSVYFEHWDTIHTKKGTIQY